MNILNGWSTIMIDLIIELINLFQAVIILGGRLLQPSPYFSFYNIFILLCNSLSRNITVEYQSEFVKKSFQAA